MVSNFVLVDPEREKTEGSSENIKAMGVCVCTLYILPLHFGGRQTNVESSSILLRCSRRHFSTKNGFTIRISKMDGARVLSAAASSLALDIILLSRSTFLT